MPRHRFNGLKGRIETLRVDSRAIANNKLGDPAVRDVSVYVPPGYEAGADYPLLVHLSGFGESGSSQVGWRSFGDNLPGRFERLMDEGRIGPAVLAMPDGFTSFGGSPYLNSPVLGDWSDFLIDELLPALATRFRVRADSTGRALFGTGAGGYGALVQGLLHGEHWGAIACHAGDMLFDVAYAKEWPRVLAALAPCEGNVARYIERLNTAAKVRQDQAQVLRMLGMCAAFDPAPEAPCGVRLPVDLHTSEVIEDRWQQWLNWDPVRLAERKDCQDRLRKLRLLLIDCGTNPSAGLHWGGRALARRLTAAGVAHRHEEFDDRLAGIDTRYDVSLPALYAAVQA